MAPLQHRQRQLQLPRGQPNPTKRMPTLHLSTRGRGERGVVEEFRPDTISVRRENGQLVAVRRDRPASLDDSYAVTGHSAQGLGADHVFIEKDTRSLTSNRRSFYTDDTRAREVATVVTDSVRRLSRVATVKPQKSAALDLTTPVAGFAREHGGD